MEYYIGLREKEISKELDISLSRIEEVMKVEVQTLAYQKKHELFQRISRESGISLQDLLKYDLISNDKITINEVIKTLNINIDAEFVKDIIDILRK